MLTCKSSKMEETSKHIIFVAFFPSVSKNKENVSEEQKIRFTEELNSRQFKAQLWEETLLKWKRFTFSSCWSKRKHLKTVIFYDVIWSWQLTTFIVRDFEWPYEKTNHMIRQTVSRDTRNVGNCFLWPSHVEASFKIPPWTAAEHFSWSIGNCRIQFHLQQQIFILNYSPNFDFLLTHDGKISKSVWNFCTNTLAQRNRKSLHLLISYSTYFLFGYSRCADWSTPQAVGQL